MGIKDVQRQKTNMKHMKIIILWKWTPLSVDSLYPYFRGLFPSGASSEHVFCNFLC